MDLSQLPWKDIITIAAASVGAVLGIMNTWNTINQRKVRVRVAPAFLFSTEQQPLGFSIDAVNLSAFPIRVAEYGFDIGGGRRIPIMQPKFPDGQNLPFKLEPREAAAVWISPLNFRFPPGSRLERAYVRTACGAIFFGTSPALKQFGTMFDDIGSTRS